jgi:hypothetical protein
MENYNFNPVSMEAIGVYEEVFLGENSKILCRENLSEIVSQLPKLKMAEKLLSVNTLNQSITPMDFHDCCDERGPTITLLKTHDGDIYGAYSPVSWISENM